MADPKTEVMRPPIPEAEAYLDRIRSVAGKPERNMEDLVKELLVALGHPREHIIFQAGHVDLCLHGPDGKPEYIFEVKRSLRSEKTRNEARRQAFDYAGRTGGRFMVLTDADTFEIYDRNAGPDFDSMFQGRFQLTNFHPGDESVLDLLRPRP
jgi:hypothetical protein